VEGHGFSRAAQVPKMMRASAPEAKRGRPVSGLFELGWPAFVFIESPRRSVTGPCVLCKTLP
jgi:hypothetical protein